MPTDNGQRTTDEIIKRDERDLRHFGYAQELFRTMGGFSNFAISFSIISILTGAVTLYGDGLGLDSIDILVTPSASASSRLVRGY